MKTIRFIILMTILFNVNAFAQETPIEDLPTATIDNNYQITLDPEIPVADYYKVDISNLEFDSEEQAKKLLGVYVTGNLITNEVHYLDDIMVIHIHTEYMSEVSYEKIQEYLGHLTKPE